MKKITKVEFEQFVLQQKLDLKTKFGTSYAEIEVDWEFMSSIAFGRIGINFTEIKREIIYCYKKWPAKTQVTLNQIEYTFTINNKKYFWYEVNGNEDGLDIILTIQSLNTEELFMLTQEAITDFRKEFDYKETLDTYEIINEVPMFAGEGPN